MIVPLQSYLCAAGMQKDLSARHSIALRHARGVCWTTCANIVFVELVSGKIIFIFNLGLTMSSCSCSRL